jgi:integrase/recombinase XerD
VLREFDPLPCRNEAVRVSTAKFIEERKYLKNVSEQTLDWYRYSFRAFEGSLSSEDEIKARIIELRQRGVKPISVNTYLRCIKAYFVWLGKPLTLGWLKEEQKIIPTFTPQHVARLRTWRPVGASQTRLHTMVLLALDTGLRVSEILGLRREDVDLDNLLLRVAGKGGKQRLVPVSIELRKSLYRYVRSHEFNRVFPSRDGGALGTRNLLRDFKALCRTLHIEGVRTSFHTLRHTFAVQYLRAGGNVFYLQRILGHSTLEMTNRYCRSLGIQDLQAVHDRLSPLRSATR